DDPCSVGENLSRQPALTGKAHPTQDRRPKEGTAKGIGLCPQAIGTASIESISSFSKPPKINGAGTSSTTFHGTSSTCPKPRQPPRSASRPSAPRKCTCRTTVSMDSS